MESTLPNFRIRTVNHDAGRPSTWLGFDDIENSDSDFFLDEPPILSDRAGRSFVAEMWPEQAIVGVVRVAPLSGNMAEMELRIRDSASPSIVAELFAHVVQYCGHNDINLIQTILPSGDSRRGEWLTELGFQFACHVDGRLLPISEPRRIRNATSRLSFVPIEPGEERRLSWIVSRTYVGSRDCPAFQGLRTVRQSLAIYRRANSTNPATPISMKSFIATDAGTDVGCLLLNWDSSTAEIVYFGIDPVARGRRFGQAMIQFAIEWSRSVGSQWLMAFVDTDNWPATRIYDEFDFFMFDRRTVMLKTLSRADPSRPSQNPAG
jgi:GNAT superfamily N-acetyltransferase